MVNCNTCGKFLTQERAREDMIECIRCSDVKPYAANIVYPHKTGAYVQPVTQEQKENIQRLDRRAVKTKKTAKGGSSSWDRWFKKYQEQKDTKPIVKKYTYTATKPKLSLHSVHNSTNTILKSKGYYVAKDYVNKLYQSDDITLITKSTIINHLTFIQSHTTKQQKLLMRSI